MAVGAAWLFVISEAPKLWVSSSSPHAISTLFIVHAFPSSRFSQHPWQMPGGPKQVVPTCFIQISHSVVAISSPHDLHSSSFPCS